MQDFLIGLEALRIADVPLECVPPQFRQEAIEDVLNATATAMGATATAPTAATTASGRRKLAQGPLSTLLTSEELAAARAAAMARTANLQELFVNLRIAEFGTAILETVLIEQVEESLNVQDVFNSFFNPLAFQKVARLEFDLIAGKEALFTLLAASPAPKTPARTPILQSG